MLSHACLLGIDLLRFLNTAFKIQTLGLLLRHGWRRSRRTRKEITRRRRGDSGPNPLSQLRAWAKPSSLAPFGVLCPLAVVTKASTGCSLWASGRAKAAGTTHHDRKSKSTDTLATSLAHLPFHPVATQPAWRCCLNPAVSIHARHIIKPEVLIPDNMGAE